MLDASTLVAFSAAVIVLSATPGPDMLLLVSRGVGQGWKAAWFTALGFTLAGVIQIPLLALGVASFVQSSPLAFDLLRYAGAAYLLWRGVRLLMMAQRPIHPAAIAHQVTVGAALKDGVVASLTNPKGLIFLLAFLPQFVDPARGSVAAQLVALGLLMKALALAVESLVAFGAGAVGRWLIRRPYFVVWQERVTGLVLVCLGVRLLTLQSSARG